MGFTKIRTTDQNLGLIQDNIDLALTPLQTAPLSGGTFIAIATSKALVIGNNQIAHGLGRVPTRWVILDINAASSIYRTSWDAQYITLNSSAVCTVSLWVA